MILYHYSTERYPELLTLLLQGNLSKRDKRIGYSAAQFRSEPYPYYEHVSFFIEPIPLEIMGSLYPKDHAIWRTGNKIYEHQVDTKNIELKYWRIVETPMQIMFLDNVPWMENDFYKRLYFKVQNTVVGKIGQHTGSHMVDMIKAVERYIGTTRQAFIDVSKRKDFDTFSNKYAANVPHLMIYTDVPIRIKKIKTVRIGGKPTLESYCAHWLNW